MKTKPRSRSASPSTFKPPAPSPIAVLEQILRHHEEGMRDYSRMSMQCKTDRERDHAHTVMGHHVDAADTAITVMSRLMPTSDDDVVIMLRAAMRQLADLSANDVGGADNCARIDEVRRIVCRVAVYNGVPVSESYGLGDFGIPNPLASVEK